MELYQAEPTIYDLKHLAHKNKMKVNDVWMRIRRVLSVDVSLAEIKKKKKRDALMASFHYYLRRKKASMKSGASSDEVYNQCGTPMKLWREFWGHFMTVTLHTKKAR